MKKPLDIGYLKGIKAYISLEFFLVKPAHCSY
jgi:hypothetical protein